MDMPPLIEIGSNPYWLFGLFAVFLLIFHGWLVYLRPIGDIGWKRVDYLWLGVAVIGLVGQSAQVRQHWYASSNEMSQFRVEGALMSLRREADFSIGPAICRTFVRSDFSPPTFDQMQAEYNFACDEFTRLTKEVRSTEGSRDVGFLDLLDTSKTRNKLTDSILMKTLENLEMAHHRFIDALKEKADAKQKTRPTTNEFVLIVFSPFLLMFALALRITKVTGEIRLKR
ncbi:MAG: hypothetical protein A2040_07590 [Rhodocyclales bacterium GWA2_65_19]|nr:MAG: hypothetical protein A2040_07590 [Rhodocyclales bacterium GWA2_65_19]